ncbi:hypothetical protein [Maribacter sp. 1_2014MBL_MicDiv]|uniref:hypothetical protein n=1 Tax=Maribacter sp. 1_2014MBL_MicDiv TaxID=1644130 RepID=UPI0008F553F9|nr:hypothetical protein [Maribacter sp. 1_2014MBL_MicDiv]
MKRLAKIIGILIFAYFFLSYVLPNFIGIPLAAWDSHKAWKDYEKEHKEVLKPINYEAIGVYEFKTENEEENHFIFIDTVETKIVGFYFGTEDSGVHGISHYGNPLANFKLTDTKIEFEIEKRELFETTRNKTYKANEKPKKEFATGVSKSVLYYSGELTEFGFKLNCQSEFNNCWSDELDFKKIYDL